MPCTQYVLYQICPVPNMSCTQYVLCSICPVPNMSCTQYVLYPICHVPNMPCPQYVMYPIFPVPNVTCTQYALYPICHVPNMPCTQYVMYPIYPVPNMSCTPYVMYPILSKSDKRCRKYGKYSFTPLNKNCWHRPNFRETHNSSAAVCYTEFHQNPSINAVSCTRTYCVTHAPAGGTDGCPQSTIIPKIMALRQTVKWLIRRRTPTDMVYTSRTLNHCVKNA